METESRTSACQGLGECAEGLVFNAHRVSVLQDEKSCGDDGGDGSTAM